MIQRSGRVPESFVVFYFVFVLWLFFFVRKGVALFLSKQSAGRYASRAPSGLTFTMYIESMSYSLTMIFRFRSSLTMSLS